MSDVISRAMLVESAGEKAGGVRKLKPLRQTSLAADCGKFSLTETAMWRISDSSPRRTWNGDRSLG
jgi:hypothetical protein